MTPLGLTPNFICSILSIHIAAPSLGAPVLVTCLDKLR